MCITFTRAMRMPDGTIQLQMICEKSGAPVVRTTSRGEFCMQCYLKDGHEFVPDENNNALICEICSRHIMDHPDFSAENNWKDNWEKNTA